MLSKVVNDDLKALKTLEFQTLFCLHSCRRNVEFFSLQAVVILGH